MEEDNYKVLKPEKYDILRGAIVDCLYPMSDTEWRGTLMNGDILIEIKLNKEKTIRDKVLGLGPSQGGDMVLIDIQKREMFLGMASQPVLKVKKFNIYTLCDYMEWQYDKDYVID